MDVFGGKWKNYVEKIKDGWYEAVSPEDTVVLIGDISWAQTLSSSCLILRCLNPCRAVRP